MKGRANAAWITWGKAPRSGERSTVIGPEIAAVERREARVPVTRHAGAFAKVPSVACAVPALRSLTHVRAKGNEGGPHADQTTGVMNHAWLSLTLWSGAI